MVLSYLTYREVRFPVEAKMGPMNTQRVHSRVSCGGSAHPGLRFKEAAHRLEGNLGVVGLLKEGGLPCLEKQSLLGDQCVPLFKENIRIRMGKQETKG